MISEAIQDTLAKIIPNTYLVMGDEEIACPYCTHKEIGTPEYLKDKLIGYNYDCEVLIIDHVPESVESYSVQVIAAIEALTKTTTKSTYIDLAVYDGPDEPDFDIESKLYTNILKFTIKTQNR